MGDDHKEYFAGEAALKAAGKDNTMNVLVQELISVSTYRTCAIFGCHYSTTCTFYWFVSNN